MVILFLIVVLNLFATDLTVVQKKITVNGKEASIYAIEQPDHSLGIRLKKGDTFDVNLKNTLNVPTSIHWHGLILPNKDDGVAFITQLPIYPGQGYLYKFPLVQTGTYWMHSHYSLQEQLLLGAPLIIAENDEPDTVLMLSDFSFSSPMTIFEKLKCKPMEKMNMSTPDIVEVDYDAFLTNYRTLDNPDIVRLEPNKKLRLRIINGASATNFHILLGDLEGEAVAVDGNAIEPLKGNKFEISVAQRIDIIVSLPKEGVYPILAQGEGTDKRTGIVLSTPGFNPPKLAQKGDMIGPLTNKQESKLKALHPLSNKKVDQKVVLELGGNMQDYVWTLNDQSWPSITPIVVNKGERVEITFDNQTTMSHPMHLHGHVFQVTAINDQPIQGAMRDTVLVMPKSKLTIQFDADNPGVWPLHCHILYHLEAGMLTVVRYKDYIQTLVPLDQSVK